jgi:hypothetical protein
MFFKGIKPRSIFQLKSSLYNFFNINDPTTPDLLVSEPIPSVGHLKFAVKGIDFPPKNTNHFRAANCFFTIANCINKTQNILSNPLKKWASCNLLLIDPAAGSDLNAYYDRRSIRLFYYNFKNKNFYFADSADVVVHELGHAILDAMRPDFWSVQSLEIWSFHEAFSDILAVFNLMNYDIALEKVLNETNGDLSKSNSASRLAEEIGILLRELTRDKSFLSNCLRDVAVEDFKYVDPSMLPSETSNDKLASECHSFGRVFSNAWYNILIRIYNLHISKGESQLESIKKARDIAFISLVQAIPLSPRVVKYYAAIAKCMINTASSKGSEYGEIVKDVFKEWNILDEDSLKILSNKSWKDVVFNLKKEDIVRKNKNGTIVSIKNNCNLALSELPLVSNLSKFGDFELEVANDHFYEFNNKGLLINEIKSNEKEIKDHAAMCLFKIENLLGTGRMWEVSNKKLIRNFI